MGELLYNNTINKIFDIKIFKQNKIDYYIIIHNLQTNITHKPLNINPHFKIYYENNLNYIIIASYVHCSIFKISLNNSESKLISNDDLYNDYYYSNLYYKIYNKSINIYDIKNTDTYEIYIHRIKSLNKNYIHINIENDYYSTIHDERKIFDWCRENKHNYYLPNTFNSRYDYIKNITYPINYYNDLINPANKYYPDIADDTFNVVTQQINYYPDLSGGDINPLFKKEYISDDYTSLSDNRSPNIIDSKQIKTHICVK